MLFNQHLRAVCLWPRPHRLPVKLKRDVSTGHILITFRILFFCMKKGFRSLCNHNAVGYFKFKFKCYSPCVCRIHRLIRGQSQPDIYFRPSFKARHRKILIKLAKECKLHPKGLALHDIEVDPDIVSLSDFGEVHNLMQVWRPRDCSQNEVESFRGPRH